MKYKLNYSFNRIHVGSEVIDTFKVKGIVKEKVNNITFPSDSYFTVKYKSGEIVRYNVRGMQEGTYITTIIRNMEKGDIVPTNSGLIAVIKNCSEDYISYTIKDFPDHIYSIECNEFGFIQEYPGCDMEGPLGLCF